MVTVLTTHPSIANTILRELRDKTIQHDHQRFEANLELLGVLAGYELSKRLAYQDITVQTPLDTVTIPVIQEELVIATVLRAGIPVHRGVCKALPAAAPAFIAAGRKPETGSGVEIDLSYIAAPSIDGKTLIIADTMLATGHTFYEAYQALQKQHGKPAKVYIISVLASQPGIEYLQQTMPEAEIMTFALDPLLNEQFFIVPGLGDAGDLLYGEKL